MVGTVAVGAGSAFELCRGLGRAGRERELRLRKFLEELHRAPASACLLWVLQPVVDGRDGKSGLSSPYGNRPAGRVERPCEDMSGLLRRFQRGEEGQVSCSLLFLGNTCATRQGTSSQHDASDDL